MILEWKRMIELICVGRLVEEKWIDMLIDVFEKLSKELAWKFKVHFFWDWVLRSELEKIAESCDEVFYYGHQPKEKVFTVRENCSYTLMPSVFLETFGLSALDSLSLWIPVVGFDKWWLSQFLTDETKLRDYKSKEENTQEVYRALKDLIENYSSQERWSISVSVKKIYEKYTWQNRLKRFQEKSWLLPWSRVALVSDYWIDIGWLENRIILMKRKLIESGYVVELFWWINHKPSRLKRLLLLPGTICNFVAARRLKRTVGAFNPDLVRYHSVHRVLWWLPLRLMRNIWKEQRIMYHDFWMFHPYPSCVYSEEQVKDSISFVWYMKESFKVSFWSFPLQIAKFFQRKVMFGVIDSVVEKHIVPSEYLVDKVKPFVKKDSSIESHIHFIEPKQ